ncbi:sensor histidine kinase [Shewanella algicola]|uniref:sensor histidine kinase n=1 Tax=Shewanella algicola TaxID=640633 RepID=UPI002494E2B6|nr:ATP-binding protein [Shewanella algicola]
MTDKSNPYYVAYIREKKARAEIEQMLEDYTRQVYEKNVLLEQQIEQIKNQQQSLIQQEKLALLGSLAAGVAHEINNPLAFVISNVTTLNSYVADLLAVVPNAQLNAAERHNIDFITEDLPELISDTDQGFYRIKDIVKNLLFFARTDTEQMIDIDLCDAIEMAVKLLGPKLKDVFVKQQLNPVDNIRFNSGELNQVLVNILVNAIQACEQQNNDAGMITITLSQHDHTIKLNIIDNGCGMPPEVKQRMFDAFYTTKPIGTGTGIGMSIVLQILQQQNAGVEVQSEVGKGTNVQITFNAV